MLEQSHIQHSPGSTPVLVLHLLSLEHHPPRWENWNSRRIRQNKGLVLAVTVSGVHPEVPPSALRCHRAPQGATA